MDYRRLYLETLYNLSPRSFVEDFYYICDSRGIPRIPIEELLDDAVPHAPTNLPSPRQASSRNLDRSRSPATRPSRSPSPVPGPSNAYRPFSSCSTPERSYSPDSDWCERKLEENLKRLGSDHELEKDRPKRSNSDRSRPRKKVRYQIYSPECLINSRRPSDSSSESSTDEEFDISDGGRRRRRETKRPSKRGWEDALKEQIQSFRIKHVKITEFSIDH
jgi:hypothetical protein